MLTCSGLGGTLASKEPYQPCKERRLSSGRIVREHAVMIDNPSSIMLQYIHVLRTTARGDHFVLSSP